MRLLSLASLAIVLSLLTLGAQAGKKKLPNAWLVHRVSMWGWTRWPKNETRSLQLYTLPTCIQRCITPENAIIEIHGQKADVRTVNRRLFCDPRLNLMNVYFIHTIGPCTFESCRYEHALEALRGHYYKWLRVLCTPPNLPPFPKGVPKSMIDPTSNYTEGFVEGDMDGDAEWDVDEEAEENADEFDTTDGSEATNNATTNV
ncbi:uncharacterized protein ColSpa_12770 [Colletotrichum spaethianum]|uniref:Secreted protein n=1 Tax=Colletotrichum spaethianum TaxID=700344 RepID=A0AA37ULC5_9PEZI|nr:uncharacterized protein ColSpa_12770 [Colletotrichum spaethianum]GKT52589.1 hypothetical protein ColSpa_12770 [Colletotrichum spaethianum]